MSPESKISSPRRIAASRANGAKSQGPVTAQGKQNSSRNALKHGLCAEIIVLTTEDPAAFQVVLDNHTARFQPADAVEQAVVEEMAAAHWRIRRAWQIEAELFDKAMDGQSGEDDSLSNAFNAPAASRALSVVQRYETRFQIAYQRAIRTFKLLRTIPQPAESKEELPNQPNPNSGQFAKRQQPIEIKPLTYPSIAAAAGSQPASEKPSDAHPVSVLTAQQPGGAV